MATLSCPKCGALYFAPMGHACAPLPPHNESPLLAAYLHMESAIMILESWDDAASERLAGVAEAVWYRLTTEEQESLKSREVVLPVARPEDL